MRKGVKAGTKKADEIHDYFIKLENIFQEVLLEESEELKKQLMEFEDKKNIEYEVLLSAGTPSLERLTSGHPCEFFTFSSAQPFFGKI